VAQALKSLDFLVVQDIFLTETARLAHLVLPGVSFAEKDGTFTNTERRVQRVRQAVPATGEARPDWEIIADLSTRMGLPLNYKNARKSLRRCAPSPPLMPASPMPGSTRWACSGPARPWTIRAPPICTKTALPAPGPVPCRGLSGSPEITDADAAAKKYLDNSGPNSQGTGSGEVCTVRIE